jgi:hypothetical protein
MKILIFYTPRSKSTMIYNILKNYYGLKGIGDILTLSRIANQNFKNYNELIDYINHSDNSCVKINANDFIDLKNKCINYDYKKIDYSSFDNIIFVTRNNYTDAVLSYAYMDPKDQSSWHRKQGEIKIASEYKVDPCKLFYLFRGYFLFEKIKNEICNTATTSKIYSYEYDTVDQELMRDFNLLPTKIDNDLAPNNLDYKLLATNYDEIVELSSEVYEKMATLCVASLNDADSFFWKDFKNL